MATEIPPTNPAGIIPSNPDSVVQIAAMATSGFTRCAPDTLDDQRVILFATSRQDVVLRYSVDGLVPGADAVQFNLVQRVPCRLVLERGVSLWFNTSGNSNSGFFMAFAIDPGG